MVPAAVAAQAAGYAKPVPIATTDAKADLNDAAIMGILDAANNWDISTGTLATSKAVRPDVKDFGAMLARDHKAAQQEARDLARKIGVMPTPPASDNALKRDYGDATMKLSGLSGAEFDKAFLEHEAAYHRAVIDAIHSQLMPAVKNPELKAFVDKIAPNFDAHLKAAETLLKKP
jgi:putative membrane protein